jgi:acetyl esterase/lipase
VPLWPGDTSTHDIANLAPYLPGATAPAAAILVCPGGGYGHLALEHEGSHIGGWFRDHGIAAFVLRYRLPGQGHRHPAPLLDVQRAMRLIRSRATEWNIDPAHLGVLGFSAGGHLASTLATHYDAGFPRAADPLDRPACRPDFAVLVYPVITLKGPHAHLGSRNNLLGPDPDPALIDNLCNETQVTAQTPPTLLVHTEDDLSVPIANSEIMLAALQKAGVPSALQSYPKGNHGFGLHSGDPNRVAPPGWLDRVREWLRSQQLV